MFAESATTPAEWLESYSPTAGRHDELKNVRGEITPVWQKLVEALKGLSAAELNQRAEQVRSLIYENGITYNVYDKQGNHARPWGMDLLPMLIDYPEWDKIERALSQRARLFNLILQDLYGPQTLIEKRVIPPALVLGNPAFLRPCHGVSPACLCRFMARTWGARRPANGGCCRSVLMHRPDLVMRWKTGR